MGKMAEMQRRLLEVSDLTSPSSVSELCYYPYKKELMCHT